MGSEDSETEQRKIQEKIEDFRKLIDTAYEIFDGKYSIDEISKMPYKILIENIEREQKEIDRKAESKASKQLANQLGY